MPHGFEGRLGIAVTGDVADSTTVQLEQEAGERVDLNAASSAEGAQPPNHRNTIAAVVKLKRIDSERLPVLVHVADEPADALMPSIDDALELRPERQPLAVLGGQADQLINITRVKRLEPAPGDLDVLLRNTRSPRPQSRPFH